MVKGEGWVFIFSELQCDKVNYTLGGGENGLTKHVAALVTRS